MIGMFEAYDYVGGYASRHYALADIEAVSLHPRHKEEKGEWWAVRRRGDLNDVYLSETMWQGLMRRPVQIMPADPSYSVVRFGCDDNGPWSFADQVLAWAVCWDGEVRPITREGVDSGIPYDEPVYVRMPNGTFEAGPHCDRIDSLEEGLDLAKRDWEATRARELRS